MCNMSRVTCHLSLTPTATVTDPPPTNYPTVDGRLVCKDPKTDKKYSNAKYHLNLPKINHLVVIQY